MSEAISLQRGDVMTGERLVRVTRSKFGKSREVPLHPSAAAALEEYARHRDELFPRPQAGAFLLGPAGSPLPYTTVAGAFRRLLDLAGVHAGPGQPRPGIHSLRHTFAVATLTGWYRDGADVASLLPLLSTYMGHTDPRSTYYYLQACPELLALAAARLQDAPGEPQ